MPATPSPIARRWCFTNFKIENIILETFCEAGLEEETALRYICFGDEVCPETGKRHMQGYCELRRPMRRASVQKLLARLGCDPKCHVEPGHSEQRLRAVNYCKKGEQPKAEWNEFHENGPNWGLNASFFEAGSWEAGGQGARNDLTPAIEFAKTNPTTWDLIERFPVEFCKYNRGLERIRILASKRISRAYRPIEVHVLWGDAGTGKTNLTGLNRDHDVFPVACGDTFPFNDYDGESTIVFDDFYGQLRCADMLSWCNGQYGAVNIKYGSAYRAWTKVYITSNTAPDTWYPNVPQDVRNAFLSRLTTITHVVGDCQRPATKYFVLDRRSGERNEVDCNTTPATPPVPAGAPAVSPLIIDDPDALAAIADLFGDAESAPEAAHAQPSIQSGTTGAVTAAAPRPSRAQRLKGRARRAARLGRATSGDLAAWTLIACEPPAGGTDVSGGGSSAGPGQAAS